MSNFAWCSVYHWGTVRQVSFEFTGFADKLLCPRYKMSPCASCLNAVTCSRSVGKCASCLLAANRWRVHGLMPSSLTFPSTPSRTVWKYQDETERISRRRHRSKSSLSNATVTLSLYHWRSHKCERVWRDAKTAMLTRVKMEVCVTQKSIRFNTFRTIAYKV